MLDSIVLWLSKAPFQLFGSSSASETFISLGESQERFSGDSINTMGFFGI